MPMPITPELAAFMRSLGYDQLRQAYGKIRETISNVLSERDKDKRR